jgi:hypothetical protein
LRTLTAAQLLTVWENALSQPPWQRAIALLAAVLPNLSEDMLARLPLGQRDAYLLSLRESLFGPKLTSLATCPACAERLELTFNLDDIRAGRLPDPNAMPDPAAQEQLWLSMDGYTVNLRLPNSLDLVEIAGMHNPEAAHARLLERCLLSIQEKGSARTAADLPPEVVQGIAGRMAEADPQGDIQILLTCPRCSHHWQAAFDPITFLWAEINAWAQRMLREVHLLAGAYGWREADILALSPLRRQAYLQLVLGGA